MDRHSRSPDSPINRRHRRRRRSRSYSRSRSRDRSRGRRRRHSRSLSHEHNDRRMGGGNANNPDMDYDYNQKDRDNRSHRQYGRRDRRDNDRHYHRNRGYSSESSDDSYSSQNINNYQHYRSQPVSNKIIVLGLPKHVTEADISNEMIGYSEQPISIRLIRKRKSGSSRGFAFVEFNTEEEASRWMEFKQGVVVIQNQYRAVMQYSFTKGKIATDWYCVKCGVFNFKRRDNCFKCNASRDECEKGGEGSDEVSNILTKKIMLRNLDVLTNEEGVLTNLQGVVPTLVSKISKVLICRDPLTQTSRGICYLAFENLVDSMNMHNALKELEPALMIDDREILITYCMDAENRQIGNGNGHNGGGSGGRHQNKFGHDSNFGGKSSNSSHQYTLADVPRLAEYSAGVYAQTSAEYEYYYKYYNDYYIEQINSGQFSNLPTMSQIGDTANSGAAVALSAMQRKQQKHQDKASPAHTSAPVQVPTGDGSKKYPTPDSSQYQYDESSGFYYDPTTGLYYDVASQYYYNSELASYMYWEPETSTYMLAPQNQPEAATKAEPEVSSAPAPDVPEAQTSQTSKPKEEKHDKVKVAKKIVKDMEKWAKQLNQKKDQSNFYVAPAQPPPPPVASVAKPLDDSPPKSQPLQPLSSGYADVGFAILENRDTRLKKEIATNFGSDSDTEPAEPRTSNNVEQELVNFEQLTCLLCKRAFQSLEILNKHLKMSNLHKDNLQKYMASMKDAGSDGNDGITYRDRAKERRQKYVESEPPPPNKTRERFEKELKKQATQMQRKASEQLAARPIDQSNLGNRMLQKMGWSEGQGLGRANQGRTNIIEAESRAPAAGLGSATTAFVPGDDYRTYIKRMMKTRYEKAEN